MKLLIKGNIIMLVCVISLIQFMIKYKICCLMQTVEQNTYQHDKKMSVAPPIR